jgi:hypothetical protein
LLARRPVRSELTHYLVVLDREYSRMRPPPGLPWERFYAQRLSEAFA